MTLNKQKGNMYPWITYTWNPIRGKCPHECKYCYMKRFEVGKLRLDKKALNDNLGEGNVIFVGSSVDMWAEKVPKEWIRAVLEKCREFPNNKYLFQSKNPKRFKELYESMKFPVNVILGTTIESNKDYKVSKAPPPARRQFEIQQALFPVMLSIEPIMDFDLNVFINWIRDIEPEFVSIGADSQNNGLPEPSWEKVELLIKGLKRFTEVILKDNLNRLMKTKERGDADG